MFHSKTGSKVGRQTKPSMSLESSNDSSNQGRDVQNTDGLITLFSQIVMNISAWHRIISILSLVERFIFSHGLQVDFQ